MKKYHFRFRFGFTLFWLSFFVLFCVLGVWQYHRYEFKKNLLQLYQERLTAAPKELSEVFKEKDLTFEHVNVLGQYLNDQTMFVQNQLYNDTMGFEVLTPYKVVGSLQLLLVDRGWIEGVDQHVLPTIKPVNGTQMISGHIKVLNEYQFILGDNILQPHAKPIVMQKIDMSEIGRVTDQIFFPFVLRLDAGQPNGFTRDWNVTMIMPERHLGYCIQWFLMAIALFIAYFCFCLERVKPNV